MYRILLLLRPQDPFATVPILSVLLFWLSKPDEIFLHSVFLPRVSSPSITPSGLVPKLDSDPKVAKQSLTIAVVGLPLQMGLFAKLVRNLEGEVLHDRAHRFIDVSNVYAIGPSKGKNALTAVYFDEGSGLFVSCDIVKQNVDGEVTWTKEVRAYAGPEGISETPDEALGRFTRGANNQGLFAVCNALRL